MFNLNTFRHIYDKPHLDQGCFKYKVLYLGFHLLIPKQEDAQKLENTKLCANLLCGGKWKINQKAT